MGITFRHDAAGFAPLANTQQNANRKYGRQLLERQQKYAFEDMQKQRDQIFGEKKAMRDRAFQQQDLAMKEAREDKLRDAQQAREDALDDRRRRLDEDRDIRRDQRDEDRRRRQDAWNQAQQTRSQLKSSVLNVPTTLPQDQQDELRGIYNNIQTLLGPDVDISDPAVFSKVQEQIDLYNSKVNQYNPSAAQKSRDLTDRTTYWNPDTATWSDKPTPNSIAFIDGQMFDPPTRQAQEQKAMSDWYNKNANQIRQSYLDSQLLNSSRDLTANPITDDEYDAAIMSAYDSYKRFMAGNQQQAPQQQAPAQSSIPPLIPTIASGIGAIYDAFGRMISGNQQQAPAPQGQMPAPQGQMPAPQDQMPAPQAPVPQPQGQMPVPQDQMPVPQDQMPVPQDQMPVPQDQMPVPQDQMPVPQDQMPVPGQAPVPQDQQPAPTRRQTPAERQAANKAAREAKEAERAEKQAEAREKRQQRDEMARDRRNQVSDQTNAMRKFATMREEVALTEGSKEPGVFGILSKGEANRGTEEGKKRGSETQKYYEMLVEQGLLQKTVDPNGSTVRYTFTEEGKKLKEETQMPDWNKLKQGKTPEYSKDVDQLSKWFSKAPNLESRRAVVILSSPDTTEEEKQEAVITLLNNGIDLL